RGKGPGLTRAKYSLAIPKTADVICEGAGYNFELWRRSSHRTLSPLQRSALVSKWTTYGSL
ncbi:hypothetical protein KM043_000177, partial [Ampulex compressa]